jgi:hypothetical protein
MARKRYQKGSVYLCGKNQMWSADIATMSFPRTEKRPSDLYARLIPSNWTPQCPPFMLSPCPQAVMWSLQKIY